MNDDLLSRHCVPCRGGVPPVTQPEAADLLTHTPGWALVDEGRRIERKLIVDTTSPSPSVRLPVWVVCAHCRSVILKFCHSESARCHSSCEGLVRNANRRHEA